MNWEKAKDFWCSCPAERELFFTNYSNKEKFISDLSRKLESEGVKVVICSRDADTTIVKVALQIEKASALVLANDTNNLCLLINHVDATQKQHGIYIKNMTRNASNEWVCYRIHDIIDNLDRVIVNFSLFAYVFTGCDSTSAIHNFGKKVVFSKLAAFSSAVFFLTTSLWKELIMHLSASSKNYSPGSSPQQIWKIKYHKIVSYSHAIIDPALLPQPPRAAYYHDLRAQHQMNIWKILSDDDTDPLNWGWKIRNGKFSPIMTDIEASPTDILKIIRCGGKGSCSSRYSCKKTGLKCALSCKECRCVTCGNIREDLDKIDGVDKDMDGNILDIFA